MTYITHLRDVRVDSDTTISPLSRKLFRLFFHANLVKPSQVTDDDILRAVAHLNDQQLDDIGIFRKVRKSAWRSSGRGMSPTPIVEFDYFWVKI